MKQWLLEVLLKKFGPSAVRGAILGIGTFIAAREGLLGPLGIDYNTTTHILTVNLSQVSMWAVAGLPALTAGVIKILNHHADQMIKPLIQKPQ